MWQHLPLDSYWQQRIKGTKITVIFFVVLGCYLLLKKENFYTALLKKRLKRDEKTRRSQSMGMGIFCFVLAANSVLNLLADFYRKKWISFALSVPLFVVLVIYAIYSHI